MKAVVKESRPVKKAKRVVKQDDVSESDAQDGDHDDTWK